VNLAPVFKSFFQHGEFASKEEEEKKGFRFRFPEDDLLVDKIFAFANLSISIPRHLAMAIGCQAVQKLKICQVTHALAGVKLSCYITYTHTFS